MKKKNMLQVFSIILCAVFIITLPIAVKAKETGSEELVYYDTEQGRFVNDIDEYMELLNNGLVTPIDPAITSFDSETINVGSNIAPLEVSEPSEKCSNIFGHKWGSWGAWAEISRTHTHVGDYCLAKIQRYRFCERTYCSAYQIETDSVWVYCVD